MQAAIPIWCVTDDKPGHRSQLQGLAEALAERTACVVRWLPVGPGLRREASALGERPQLILCAGHRTHWPSLRLKWRHGGILVALLKPSLPRQLFDLCVIPEHDGARPGRRVVLTCGTLNDIRPAAAPDPGRGLILIGGPSRHHRWEDDDMLDRIDRLRGALPAVSWTLTTSRRTPDSFLAAAAALTDDQLKVVPVAETDRAWLRRHYDQCGVIWVTEDSASMVYESLTAGASVGVLPVPRHSESRVSRGLDKLLRDGWVTGLSQLCATGRMNNGRSSLNEAGRVADYILYWIQRES